MIYYTDLNSDNWSYKVEYAVEPSPFQLVLASRSTPIHVHGLEMTAPMHVIHVQTVSGQVVNLEMSEEAPKGSWRNKARVWLLWRFPFSWCDDMATLMERAMEREREREKNGESVCVCVRKSSTTVNMFD